MDFKYDKDRHRTIADFIILTPSVLNDLARMEIKDFESMPPGAEIRLGNNIRIPVDDKLNMQVKYIGLYDTKRSKRSFKQISYYELVAKRLDPASFQGKVFVLGSTAPAMFDLVSAPHEAEYPGALIHTTILENILNENFLQILDEKSQLLIMIGIALLCAIITNLLPLAVGIVVLVLMIASYFLVGLEYFDTGLYIGMARQSLTIIASFVVIMVIRYVFENREKRFLDRTFKQYISPELIDQMKEAEEMPKLGGEEVTATAYFTDIAGFSSFSEAIGSPEKLVELLNEYLGAMTELLSKEKGTLDKYIGDAIVAIFGAPVRIENHAERACVLSLKMQKHLALLRNKWKSDKELKDGEFVDKWPKLVHKMHMRIGINTGKMVVGNMGSELRKNYTMMGDTVNLAARLESAAKQYGVFIQVSDETLREVTPDLILSRPLDFVVVMGKTEPVLCHELLALKEEITPDQLKLVETWNKAREAYVDQRWDEAIALYEECLALEPFHPDREPGSKTTPSHVFIKRCQAYKVNPPVPPGEKWDGVYTATSK